MRKILFLLFVFVSCSLKSYAVPGKRTISGPDLSGTYNDANVVSGALSVVGSTTTAALFVDSRYQGYTSTGTAGRATTTGVIANTPTGIITNYSILSSGGNAEVAIDGISGVVYIREGVPFSDAPILPLVSSSFNITSLDSGTTVYYTILGGN